MRWWVVRRSVHSSICIAILSFAVIMGILISAHVTFYVFGTVAWLIGALGCITIGFWRRRIYVIPLIIVGGGLLGMWRGSLHVSELSTLHGYIGQSVRIVGTLPDDADTNTAGELVLRLSDVQIGSRAVPGKIWATVTRADIKRSDSVTLIGKLARGFASFDATMYRAQLVDIVRPQPGDQARVIRDWFSSAVQRAIPTPQSSLGIGYLVGQKQALSADLIDALKIAGLTHVIVASGYNLTILVRLARRLFMRVSKYTAALAAGLMIASFVAITGLSPSMSRASLVASLSLAAWYYGRRFHPVVLLSFAAGVTVMVQPDYLSGDLGWELSFAAFGGVMIFAPLLQAYFFGDKKPGLIRQILGETVAALIVTAPILIGAFGQFSNVAIIANLLVLPFVPLAMLLTFIAGIGAVVVPGFAMLIATPATWLLGYMINVAQWLSHVSWAVTSVTIAPLFVALSYVVLVGICLYLRFVTHYDLRRANIIE